MPFLSVFLREGMCRIPFKPGPSVIEILDTTNIKVRSSCGGVGTCGQCTICVEEGSVNQPTDHERNRLGPDLIGTGFRLACQVRPQNDVRVTVENILPKPVWRILQENESYSLGRGMPARSSRVFGQPPAKSGFGAAVDLGTTHIRASIWNLQTGKHIAGRVGLNPQSWFGADVLTRLMAASESRKSAFEIGDLARNAIRDAILDISKREGMAIQDVVRVVIVGNTAMLALFSGKNHARLLHPDSWMEEFDCLPDDPKAFWQTWGLDAQTQVELVPPLAGFVGSDLLAGILATALPEGPAGSLLVDFGTNSEMALWDGETVWVTSAAGGPAFEGCGISCGMPAEPGAIHTAEWKPGMAKFVFQVIGEGQARGICGSGLVDLIAGLIEMGKLKSNGRFSQPTDAEGFILGEGAPGITLKIQDIDGFQRAKAAISAGTQCLLEKAGLGLQNLQRIYVGGTFGSDLNLKNAQAIGLLPSIPTENIELCGNTALAGCEFMLLSPDGPAILERLPKKCRVINMSLVSGFDELFMENLFLQSVKKK